MSLISLDFAVFFLVVAIIYFVSPSRYRWQILLAASAVFCAYSNWGHLLVLGISITFNYVLTRLLGTQEQGRRKNLLLGFAIVGNVGLLAILKYVTFDRANLVQPLPQPFDMTGLRLLAPLGISFYTFQQLGYLIDIYRGKVKPETHFGIYAAFVSFFPQLSAGPIARSSLLPQFRQKFDFDQQRVIRGFRLILLGVFKKVVIAQYLSVAINSVFDNPRSYTGLPLWVATIFYAFQIYADFSGYTDIALGIAAVLGFKLAHNFKQPYFSSSIREFWQRWHISLSTWIREYLFFPLTRKAIQISQGKASRLVQLLVSVAVMAIVGLWHGPNWTFVIWGVLHGIFLGVEAIIRVPSRKKSDVTLKDRIIQLGSVLVTFGLVCFTWIFFRANSLGDAGYIAGHLFVFPRALLTNITLGSGSRFLVSCLMIIGLLGIDALDARWGIQTVLERIPGPMRLGVYYAVVLAIIFLGVINSQVFIYAQF